MTPCRYIVTTSKIVLYRQKKRKEKKKMPANEAKIKRIYIYKSKIMKKERNTKKEKKNELTREN